MRWRDNFQEGCTVALFKRDAHALLRDDVLVVLDAIPAVAGDLPTLRGALLALQGCR